MYLTKFPVNTTRRETRQMLISPYRLHAAIEGSFPFEQQSAEGRILWRIDYTNNGPVNLYIVSPSKPSLVGLDEQIGWPDIPPQWESLCYDSFLSQISVGQQYSFRLVANPVVNRKAIQDKNGRSKRIPHLTMLQQAAWLIGNSAYDEYQVEPPKDSPYQSISRAERNGFIVIKDQSYNILQLKVSNSKRYEFQTSGKTKVTLSTVCFDGLLKVTDPDLLRHALTFGIGHGKGFGCGLLTLARL